MRQMTEELYQSIRAVKPEEPKEEVLLHQSQRERLLNIQGMEKGEISRMVALIGRKGSGRKFLLRSVAWEKNKYLFFMQMGELHAAYAKWGWDLLFVLKRQMEDCGAYLCLIFDDGGTEDSDWDVLWSAMEETGISAFLIMGDISLMQGKDCAWIPISFPDPEPEERRKVWAHFLGQGHMEEAAEETALSGRYNLNTGEIRRAVRCASLMAESYGREKIGRTDILEGIRQCRKSGIEQYARRVPAVFGWDDLVTEPSVRQNLKDICSQVVYRDVVGEQWGFYEKKPYGTGICALFYGPPGTGKTMAAQVIAKELDYPLYQVDLSRMLSKYIGETQKNISSLFEEAEKIQAILLFDEADAFFTRRAEVKDSHDRHSNGEVAHLLQSLEAYGGISILTTNLKENMDSAFRRRIKMTVPFVLPGEEVRKILWRKMLPEKAVCEGDLDLDFFAAGYEASPSEIQEILISAAFMAAAEGGGIGNRHVARALRKNFLKYGRVIPEGEMKF